MDKKLKVMTYNIHKGFNTRNKDFVLDKIKQSIEKVSADIVFLQEVVGSSGMGKHNSQFEFIADTVWTHHSYGKNAVSTQGHHGNAILSKYPFSFTKNIDLSTNKFEKRGMIHGIIEVPGTGKTVHLLCTHLNLLESERSKQALIINKYIKENIPAKASIILAGDFNDWRNVLSQNFFENHKIEEAFLSTTGDCAKTFPSLFPLLSLDRIYFRNLEVLAVNDYTGTPWDKLSDHLAIGSTFKIKKRG